MGKLWDKLFVPLTFVAVGSAITYMAVSNSKVEKPSYFYTSKNCVDNAKKKVDDLGLGHLDFDKLNNLHTKKGVVYHLEETDPETGECRWERVDN